MKRNRLFALILALAMIISCLAGCGGKADEPADNGGAQANAPASENKASDAETVKYKDTIYTCYGNDLDTPDPYGSSGAQNMFFSTLYFDTLTYLDPDSGEVMPELATSWKDVSDGAYTAWEVKLVENATFHNGDHLTAEDVKFTWEYCSVAAEKVVKVINVTKYVDSIEVKDDYTVVFNLNTSLPDFPSYMETKIYSKNAFDTMDAAEAAVIGSGPYMYDAELTQSGVSFGATRYDNYWRGTENYPTKHIVFKVIKDANTQIAAIASGELDVMFSVANDSVATLSNMNGLETYSRSGAQSYYMGFNYSRPDMANLEIRKAICQAINKDDIVAVAFNNGTAGTANNNFVVPTGLGYTEINPVEYDLESAKKVLEENGIVGTELTLAFYKGCQKIAEVIQANLQSIGITVNLRVVDSANWYPFKTAQAEYDMFLDYCSYQGALMYNFNRFFHSQGASNCFGYNNPEYDAMDEKVMTAGSYENMLNEFYILEQWAADNIPVFPLAYNTITWAARENVGGLVLAPTTNYVDLSTVYAIEE